MIAVDTSALMAVILGEDKSAACSRVLEMESDLLISAGTVAEALIVADRRDVSPVMNRLLDGLGFEIVPVTTVTARRILDVYRRWGKGRHDASLNFGDCFAYDIAKTNACALLFVGDGFSKTDVDKALT
jgi:ribonuclease VapC